MASFDFTLDDDGGNRRAFRAEVPGLSAVVRDKRLALPVKDVSATGFAVVPPEGSFTEGEEFTMDLAINNKIYIAELTCVVVRILDNGIVGCDFVSPDRRQEARLDKLVLEVQKRIIAKKRAGFEPA